MVNKIKQAYLNIFGAEPTKRELDEIQRESGFWGTDEQSIAKRLIESQRFAQMEVNDKNVERIFLALFGAKPTPAQLQEVKSKWGKTMPEIARTGMSTQAFSQNQKGRFQLGYNPANKKKEINQNPFTMEDYRQNALKAGVSLETLDRLEEKDLKVIGGIGAMLADNYKRTKQMPRQLTAKTLDELFAEAEKRADELPFFNDELARGMKDAQMRLAEMQDDRDWIEQNMEEKFKKDADALRQELSNRGMFRGSIKDTAKTELAGTQADLIESTDDQFEGQFREFVRGFENTWGTERLREVLGDNPEGVIQGGSTQFGLPQLTSRLGETFTAEPSSVPITGEFDRRKAQYTTDLYNTMVNTNETLKGQ